MVPLSMTRSGRFFVCHYIAEWSKWHERHRRQSDEGSSE